MPVDIMTAVPPHWGPVRVFLGGPPVWVVFVVYLLASRGWRARRPARITLLQMAVFPVLVLLWHAWRLSTSGAAPGVMMLAWLAALVMGTWLGRALVQGMRLTAEDTHGLVSHAGDRSWLPLALGFFFFEYAIVRVQVWDSTLRGDLVFLTGYAAVAGLLAGLFLGRLEGLLRKYRQARGSLPTAGRGA